MSADYVYQIYQLRYMIFTNFTSSKLACLLDKASKFALFSVAMWPNMVRRCAWTVVYRGRMHDAVVR